MNTKFNSVELHISSTPEFTLSGFGDQVKKAGGTYFSARSEVACRFVMLPMSAADLIDTVVNKFAPKGHTTMIARDFEDQEIQRAPSWLQVHHFRRKDGRGPKGKRPTEFLVSMVNESVDTAIRRGLFPKETKDASEVRYRNYLNCLTRADAAAAELEEAKRHLLEVAKLVIEGPACSPENFVRVQNVITQLENKRAGTPVS